MRDRLRTIVPFLLGVVLLLGLLAGCSSQSGTTGNTNTNTNANTSAGRPDDMELGIVREWAESTHAVPVTFAAEEDGCKNCHDGLTFSQTGGGFQPRGSASTGSSGTSDSTATTGSTGKRDWVVATDCRACHTGAGAQIANRGTVDQIPNIDSAKGGYGAVCMACHNGWHPAGAQNGELSAPHPSTQTDMLYAVNTLGVGGTGAGASSGSTGTGSTSSTGTGSAGSVESPHLKATDTCVACHVTVNNGQPDHSFKASFKRCQQEGCHKNDMTGGGQAKEDYDGNGTTGTQQEEVKGLLGNLSDAINKSAGSTAFTSQGGQVVFKGATVSENDPAYAAAYNYFYVVNDKSNGIHNPQFTVQLLQDSISAVSK